MIRQTFASRIGAAVLMVGLASVGVVADDAALADAAGRRRAAENGLSAIKQKSPTDAGRGSAAYTEAATRQNAWLDLTVSAVNSPVATAPDVQSIADAAAAALIPWVNARNEALGQPTLTPLAVDVTKRAVVKNLLAISTSAWKDYRGAKAQKRAKAVDALNQQLRWKSFAEVSASGPAAGR